MFQFFHGWRRKAGVLTLGMACAITIAWMRSRVVIDQLAFCIAEPTEFHIYSARGTITWWSWSDSRDPWPPWISLMATDLSADESNDPPDRKRIASVAVADVKV
eukprot:TRINITY_DN8224_c0_g1_i9.p1 TRINITY_DN8224_c0_g1~~TRINITY_DN8224_c0_g1_i9.p1  ORF type:complete len:104 (-),score=5.44 TRINITY_DN8224_c0_g1_i9:24-335(-)